MGQQMQAEGVHERESVREENHLDDRRSSRPDGDARGGSASERSEPRALDLAARRAHDIRAHLVAGARRSPFSVGALLESVADTVRPIAVEKDLELRVIAPPDDDERLGHRPTLNRVLLNLATNAVEFTEEGYVEIAATSSVGRRLSFYVRDTGPGLTSMALETYLDPLRESRAGNGYRLSGTGLGLTTCEKLLQFMGSKLKVETRRGWGTRFHFELDLPPVRAFTS